MQTIIDMCLSMAMHLSSPSCSTSAVLPAPCKLHTCITLITGKGPANHH
jgi:hypothetical protein